MLNYLYISIFCLGTILLTDAKQTRWHSLSKQAKEAQGHLNFGKAHQRRGDLHKAKELFLKAQASDPFCYDALVALAEISTAEDQFDLAVAYQRQALQLRPYDPTAMVLLANALVLAKAPDEALDVYFSILSIAPYASSVLYNIAHLFKKLGNLDTAMPFYMTAYDIDTQIGEINFDMGMAFIQYANGNPFFWQEGWKLYEWRFNRPGKKRPDCYQPAWDGSDLHDKTLLLYAEQGLGDTLQFIRYAEVAKKHGAKKVVALVQKELVNLIKLMPHIDAVHAADDDDFWDFDTYAALMSMPYLTKTPLDAVPASIPYLYAEPTLVKKWHETLAKDKRFKVGICWRGNNHDPSPAHRQFAATKSMPLTALLPLMNCEHISVYSLQKTCGVDQLESLPAHLQPIVFDGDFDNSAGRFMDTAALIKNLDLVITIDTSICHLAAGLGVPTWTLMPHVAEFRWMRDCDSTPWYPNMRLFRQTTSNDWNSVMEIVMRELQAHLQDGKPLITHEQPYRTH